MRFLDKNIDRLRRAISALPTGIGRQALRRGVAATLTPQPLLRRLQPTVVVDVGANRGQFALDVSKASPHARIFSFEPLSSEAAVFRQVFSGYQNVELRQCALGAATGTARMHVAGAADSSSLLEIGSLQEQIFAGTREVRVEEVDVETLDDVLLEHDLSGQALLKIDVQGFELEVLRGARDSLRKFRWIYVELSFVELYVGQPLAHEVIEFLRVQGFVPVDTGMPLRSKGRTVQLDFLFERTTTTDE